MLLRGKWVECLGLGKSRVTPSHRVSLASTLPNRLQPEADPQGLVLRHTIGPEDKSA